MHNMKHLWHKANNTVITKNAKKHYNLSHYNLSLAVWWAQCSSYITKMLLSILKNETRETKNIS